MFIKPILSAVFISIMLSSGIMFSGQVSADEALAKTSVSSKSVHYEYANVDGFKIFYREAGDPSAPTILLLHGFPTSSHMYRNLIPLLAHHYHVIAPDLPGFGFSDAPARGQYQYTFENIASTMNRFTEVIGLHKFAIQVFDYGAPTGFRMALKHPERITAIITQNGNAYDEGLGKDWDPIKKYWKNPTESNREALRGFLKYDAIKDYQYINGARSSNLIAPETYALDAALIARPGNEDIQLDLFLDYASNVVLYPKFQQYLRKHQPPLLAVWGKHDPLFIPAGAKAYKKDLPDAEVHLYDAGHFALESNLQEIAPVIQQFLKTNLKN